MGYNVENFRKIREEYKEKYKIAEAEADARRRELWSKIGGLREIDRALSDTGPRLLNAVIGKSSETFEASGQTLKDSMKSVTACLRLTDILLIIQIRDMNAQFAEIRDTWTVRCANA